MGVSWTGERCIVGGKRWIVGKMGVADDIICLKVG